jgi:hypothetical protein
MDLHIEQQLCYFGKAEGKLAKFWATRFLCQSILKKICSARVSSPQMGLKLYRTDAQPVRRDNMAFLFRLEIHGNP